MTQFKVGDRVRHDIYGIGTVKATHTDGTDCLAVELDIAFWRHNCEGLTKDHHGAYCSRDRTTPVRPSKVGQKARIADKPSNPDFWYDEGYRGKVVTITQVLDNGTCFDTKADAFTFGQFIPVADLILIHEDPVEAVVAATPKPKVRTFQKGSQCSRILSYLLRGSSITPIKARALFGTERLAARILELKQGGHKVISTIRTDENGKVYAEYSLRATNRFGNKVAA